MTSTWEKMIEQVVALLRATVPDDHKKYRAVVTQIEEMAKDLKLPCPEIMLVKTNYPLAALIDGKHIAISPGILKAMGVTNPKKSSTKEMAAVIAHEFSHYKNFKLQHRIEAISQWGMPLVAIAGYGLIHHAVKKSKRRFNFEVQHDGWRMAVSIGLPQIESGARSVAECG